MAAKEIPKTIASELAWELWYQDTFDRECPRQVELVGKGLLAGLIELWKRHLSETVLANGSKGFARFNLWTPRENQSIAVVGDWDGLVRLRGWVSEGDQALLKRIATTHLRLTIKGKTSEVILATAKSAENLEDFELHLIGLE